MPDSCTHIARECPDHEAMRISRHIAAYQLVYAAIRKTAKGDGDLHSALDLILVIADIGVQSMTTRDTIESLSPTSEDTDLSPTKDIPHD